MGKKIFTFYADFFGLSKTMHIVLRSASKQQAFLPFLRAILKPKSTEFDTNHFI